jgi:hypothetical protein
MNVFVINWCLPRSGRGWLMVTKKDENNGFSKEIDEYVTLLAKEGYEAERTRTLSLERLSGYMLTLNTLGIALITFQNIESIPLILKSALILLFSSIVLAFFSLCRFSFHTFPYPKDSMLGIYRHYSTFREKEKITMDYVSRLDKLTRSIHDKNEIVLCNLQFSMGAFFIAIILVFANILC